MGKEKEEQNQQMSIGKGFIALFVAQAQQTAALTQIQSMMEELYAEQKGQKLEEVRQRVKKANVEAYTESLKSILEDAGLDKELIDDMHT
jgi:peptidyl-tRNA hydrolase